MKEGSGWKWKHQITAPVCINVKRFFKRWYYVLYFCIFTRTEQHLKRREFKVNSRYWIHSTLSAAFLWLRLPLSCSTCCLPITFEAFLPAGTSLCILYIYILCTCYLADIVFLLPRANLHFLVEKGHGGKMFSSFCVWKASEGDLDLGRWRSAVIRSGFG